MALMGDIATVFHVYQRKAKDLGRPCDFKNHGPSTLQDSQPDPHRQRYWTRLDLVEGEISNTPTVSELGTNTERKQSRARGQLHLEGSWPKDVDDVEHKLRYRRKAEKEDGYVPALKSLVSSVESVVDENNAVDIYEQYFAAARAYGAQPDTPVVQTTSLASPRASASPTRAAPPSVGTGGGADRHVDASEWMSNSIQTITVFCDPLVADPRTGKLPTTKRERTVSCVAWQPVEGLHGRRMAVAYANLRSPQPNATMCTLLSGEALSSYIWDLTNSNAPELTLDPPAQLSCLEYNHKDLHLLGGGCIDGSLCCFDCRRGGRAVLSTPLFGDDASGTASTGATEAVGAGPVTAVKWLHATGKGHEVLTANGTDTVRVWDTRQLRDPVDSIIVRSKNSDDSGPGANSIICIDYDAQLSGSKFLTGSGGGRISVCSTRGRTPHDRVLSTHSGHHGPVCAVRRNPQVPKAFVSCGDWTVRVWHENLRSPVIVSRYQRSCLVDVAWHPSQAGVFVSAQMNGGIDVWNIACKQIDPLLSVSVTADRLHCLRLHPGGELAAAGSMTGRTHLLRLPRRLIEPAGGMVSGLTALEEQEEVAALIEREAARERNLQTIRKERVADDVNKISEKLERRKSGETRSQRAQQERELMQITAKYICDMEQRCGQVGGMSSNLGTGTVGQQVTLLKRRFVAATVEGQELLDREVALTEKPKPVQPTRPMWVSRNEALLVGDMNLPQAGDDQGKTPVCPEDVDWETGVEQQPDPTSPPPGTTNEDP
eukprot:Hpha_TRINITY_DN3338_c0_g1::TRINITY_DN3338_c0_g1_i1::g.172255::m.172255/K11143/DNAI2; dynein intermediate chain 2, axonemal